MMMIEMEINPTTQVRCRTEGVDRCYLELRGSGIDGVVTIRMSDNEARHIKATISDHLSVVERVPRSTAEYLRSALHPGRD